MFRLVYVVLTRPEGHDMTGYFLSGPGRYNDVEGGRGYSWGKIPSSFRPSGLQWPLLLRT